MINRLWTSAKKVTKWWITLASIALAIWPVPSEWNHAIPINLRLLLAIILLAGIIFWMLFDCMATMYHSTFNLEEKIQKTNTIVGNGGKKHYEVYVNHNPAYKSTTYATVYLKMTASEIDPVYERLCNGQIVNVKVDSATMVVCTPDSSCSAEELSRIDTEITNTNRKKSEAQLIVLPFYEKEAS